MREIKFRAWDTIQEIMLPVEKIDFRNNIISLDEGDSSVSDSSEMFILLQYTGLKDRNGKEIYEGDIVEISHPKLKGVQEEGTERGRILFNDERGQFAWQEPESGVLYGLTSDDKANEVIGNIYENPELLEAQQVNITQPERA